MMIIVEPLFIPLSLVMGFFMGFIYCKLQPTKDVYFKHRSKDI